MSAGGHQTGDVGRKTESDRSLTRSQAASAGAEAMWRNSDGQPRVMVNVRLSRTELRQLDALVEELGKGRSQWSPVTRSEAIRAAIELAAGGRKTLAGESET